MDLNALPAVTTADLAQPASAEFFTAHGATPEQAAALAASHNLMSGRHGEVARTSISSMFDNMAPAVKPAQPAPSTTPAAAADLLQQGDAAELSAHLDELYAPPTSSYDYPIPSAVGEVNDTSTAMDSAFVQVLHSMRTPVSIGEAIMKDMQSGRITPKDAATTEALKGWATSLLAGAGQHPAISSYASAKVDQVLAILSPETVIAMTPWVKHLASRKG